VTQRASPFRYWAQDIGNAKTVDLKGIQNVLTNFPFADVLHSNVQMRENEAKISFVLRCTPAQIQDLKEDVIAQHPRFKDVDFKPFYMLKAAANFPVQDVPSVIQSILDDKEFILQTLVHQVNNSKIILYPRYRGNLVVIEAHLELCFRDEEKEEDLEAFELAINISKPDNRYN
jgi:hypothetical protein